MRFTKTTSAFLILIIIIIGLIIVILKPKPLSVPSGPTGVACTEEAKQCPDGSYVGRTGPECQFSQCPTASVTIPPITVVPPSGPSSNSAGPGEHCGGNMTTTRSCTAGYHCAPTPGSHLPFGDVGGTCVKN